MLTDAVHQMHIGAFAATADANFFVTPSDRNIDIVGIDLYSAVAIAANATDKWSFQITNVLAAVNLLSAAQSTATYAIVAGVAYPLLLDQNLSTLVGGALLKLTATKGGSAATMTSVYLVMRYRIRS